MVERNHRVNWGRIVILILLTAVAVVAVVAFLNREWIVDYFRGQAYQPSAEMVQIRKDLRLTERGEFLFNAAQPELNEAAEFNSHCRDGESEIAVLGCYTDGSIFIYNITDVELDGIRELTAAHELLHANWARMSEDEKLALVEPLTHVFEDNQDFLDGEIRTYDTSQRQEELYVRAGTEVASLPDALERHYAEIFSNQDMVVAFYDSYIGVFRALQSEMDALKAEMESINVNIENTTAEYERRTAQLNADIVSFNSCAEVAGCFKTEDDFATRRSALVAEQEALELMYNQINDLIADYNAKVELYNADVSHGEKLNNLINSAARPQEVE